MAAVGIPPNQRGIQLSKVSPAFLHANSTSHTWAFSAFAELIDNAYDPDVSASELLIDKLEINGRICLIFLDNGAGMDTDKLLKMLSFGFCDKEVYERASSHLPIGHYGNGFKSGSMRLGKDALVFTRCQSSASIGFLSQTYLKAIEADSVFIPIVTYRLPKLERIKSEQSRNNLNAILKYSVFQTEQDLKEELHALEGSMTGTKIILSNLKRLQDGTLELDFSSDNADIRCPEAHEVDLTSVYHRPVQLPTSEYKHSLREYCSILFLRPRMKITIRGRRVKSRLISKSLSNTEFDSYKPTWLNRPLKITFGFTCQKNKTEDYGMMLYHRNRLIKAFEKVGYQKQPNDLGIGVVGVAQVDFLQPTHNKQDFNKDEKFNSVMMAFANKLNDYWNEKKEGTPTAPNQQSLRAAPDWTWAQCEMCLKWRRLPDGIDKDSLPEQWFCRINPDATHNRCEIPEEPEDEDLAIKPTYVKTFKRKREEKKRLEMLKQNQEMELQRERELRDRALESAPMVNSMQKALAEAENRRVASERRMFQMQERMRQMEAQLEGNSIQPKQRRKDQMMVPVAPPEYSGNSNLMNPPSKRKANQADSPKNAKVHLLEQESNKASSSRNFQKNSNNSNASKPHASSPLRLKIGGLLNKEKAQPDQKSPPIKKSRKSASSSKNNETFVDLTEDIDYEITLNEDYDSDEDVKPDVNKLNSPVKGKDKKKGNETEAADFKPDKNALDRKCKENSETKESPVPSKEILQDIKQETTPNKTPALATASSDGPSRIADNYDGDGHAPGVGSPEGDSPSENLVSSNVNKVMAALENKFQKSISNETKIVDVSDRDKQSGNTGKEKSTAKDVDASKDSLLESKQGKTDRMEKECITAEKGEKETKNAEKETNDVKKEKDSAQINDDKDIIEIDSDEDDIDLGEVSIKKEMVEALVDEDKSCEDNKALGTELHEEVQGTAKEVCQGISDGGADIDTQPYEAMETESEETSCDRKGDKEVVAVDDNGVDGVIEMADSMEGVEDESVLKNKEIVTCSENSSGNSDSSTVKADDGNSDKHKDLSTKISNNLPIDSERPVVCGDGKDSNGLSVHELNSGEGSSNNNGDCDTISKDPEEALQNHDVPDEEMPEAKGGTERKETINCEDELNSSRSKEVIDKNDICDKQKINCEIEKSQSKSLHSNEMGREKNAPGSSHLNEGKQSKSYSNVDKEGEVLDEHIVENMSNQKDECILETKDDKLSDVENDKIDSPASFSEDFDGCDEDDCSDTNNDNISVKESVVPNEEKASVSNCEDNQSQSLSSDKAKGGDSNSVITKQRFKRFLNNVHHLLGLLCPDTRLGDVDDIEQTVQTMIQIHREGSQSQGVEPHGS